MKVLLGFSGGVDSSVSAVLLREAGLDVYGLYLDNALASDREFAETAAAHLGIPLKTVDVKQDLEKNVCAPFCESYLHGETPNPCILCNPSVKFRLLLEEADRIGAEAIATGHYARVENGALYRGQPANDQSYMLCRLRHEQLERLILPLGPYEKAQVRSMAAERGLDAAHKSDSMEICFIPDKDYISWMAARGTLPPGGDFIFHGKAVGKHEGIFRWTVGQRIPGLYEGRKLYVCRIDAQKNTIELALWEELFRDKLTVRDFHWLTEPPDFPVHASVRVRHTKWEMPACTVFPEGSRLRIECEEPVRAPAPGQSAVLYEGDRVLGGGFIC